MVAFLLTLFALLGLFEGLSLRDPLDRLQYDTYPSKPSVDPGEGFEVVSVIENPRRLPMSYLELHEALPQEMALALEGDDVQLVSGGRSYAAHKELVSRLFLPPRRRVERRVKASLPRRGRYLLCGATVICGDFLGLKTEEKRFNRYAEIVVVPTSAQNAPELRTLGGFLGDVSVRRFTMEDPVLTLGFREYTGREPMRAISWVQTARAGKLMVKLYDHTLEPMITVLLSVDCGPDRAIPQRVERCFSLARSVCEALERQKIPYAFMTNAAAMYAMGFWSAVPEGLGPDHLRGILEGLGRATLSCRKPLSTLLEQAERAAERGRSHILITPIPADDAAARLARFTGGEAICVPAEGGEL